jgi:hypothetical protein
VFNLQHTLLLEPPGISKATNIPDPAPAILFDEDQLLQKLPMGSETGHCIVRRPYAFDRVLLATLGNCYSRRIEDGDVRRKCSKRWNADQGQFNIIHHDRVGFRNG